MNLRGANQTKCIHTHCACFVFFFFSPSWQLQLTWIYISIKVVRQLCIYICTQHSTHTLSPLFSNPLSTHPPSSHLIFPTPKFSETPLKKTNAPRIPTPPPNYQPLSKHTRSYRREPTVNTGKRFSRNRTRASRAFAAGVCFLAFPKPCEKKKRL